MQPRESFYLGGIKETPKCGSYPRPNTVGPWALAIEDDARAEWLVTKPSQHLWLAGTQFPKPCEHAETHTIATVAHKWARIFAASADPRKKPFAHHSASPVPGKPSRSARSFRRLLAETAERDSNQEQNLTGGRLAVGVLVIGAAPSSKTLYLSRVRADQRARRGRDGRTNFRSPRLPVRCFCISASLFRGSEPRPKRPMPQKPARCCSAHGPA